MSLNHLLDDKELNINIKDVNSTTATITTANITNSNIENASIDNLQIINDVTVPTVEANQVFTKGYDGNDYHALDTSFSTYALVSAPRYTGATLYFSQSQEAILPAPPPSPGLYDVVSGKNCVITRCGNVVTQKYSFSATCNVDPSDLLVTGACYLYFIIANKNTIEPNSYSVRWSGKANPVSNGFDIIHIQDNITTKTEAGNTYGELLLEWDRNVTGKVRPGLTEVYLCDFEISWIENPILPPAPP